MKHYIASGVCLEIWFGAGVCRWRELVSGGIDMERDGCCRASGLCLELGLVRVCAGGGNW